MTLVRALDDDGEPIGEQRGAIKIRTARELCALPDPDRSAELLGPLVVRGNRTIIGGHTGEGKTTFTAAVIEAIVKRHQFLGWRGAGARALVLDLEQGLRTVKRVLREAGLADSDAVDYALIPDGLELDTNGHDQIAVEELLGAGDYDVVVLDPHYKAHRGDANDERAVVDFMRLLDAWRDLFGFALVLPVHYRKPANGQNGPPTIHDVFGSSGLVRGAEVIVGLQRLDDGYSRLWFFKDRDGELPVGKSWGLLFDREEGFRRDPNDASESRYEKAPPTEIAEWISQREGASASPSEIREHFGLSEGALTSRRADLEALGIEHVNRGSKSHYRVAEPAPANPHQYGFGTLPFVHAVSESNPAPPAVETVRDSKTAGEQGFSESSPPAPSKEGDPADCGAADEAEWLATASLDELRSRYEGAA
jgi:hypothetical protein